VGLLRAALDERTDRQAGDRQAGDRVGGADLGASTVDGALFVDGNGHRQTLCGVWRTAALRERVERFGRSPEGLAGRPLRELLSGLRVVEVSHRADGPPPWYDCDTQADLEQARRWSV
jgi:molybdenum cofactor guanylyltransferase